MNVDAGYCSLNGARQFDVEITRHIRRQAGLHANLGRAHVHRFLHAPDNFVHRQKVSLLAPIRAAERAKAAMLHADVRKVDIPIDDVGDNIADLSAAQFVGGRNGGVKVRAFRLAELEGVLPADFVSIERAAQNRLNRHRTP